MFGTFPLKHCKGIKRPSGILITSRGQRLQPKSFQGLDRFAFQIPTMQVSKRIPRSFDFFTFQSIAIRTWTSGWADFEIPSPCWVCCDSARYDSMQWLACNDLECGIFRLFFYAFEERVGVGVRSSTVFQFPNHESDLQSKCGSFPTNCSSKTSKILRFPLSISSKKVRIIRTC